LEDSGWVEALVQAKVAYAGIADSFIKVSHVTHMRYAHQITASSLYILLGKSYNLYIESLGSTEQQESFEIWSNRCRQESPQFQYWHTALQLELLVLTYVKSLRTVDFHCTKNTLCNLLHGFSVWTILIMLGGYQSILETWLICVTHPAIALEFNKGYFTVHKTERVFSSMAGS